MSDNNLDQNPPKRKSRKRTILIVIGVIFVLAIFGNLIDDDTGETTASEPEETQTSEAPESEEEEPTEEPTEEPEAEPTEEATEEPDEEEPTEEPADPLQVIAQATGDDQAEAHLEPGENGEVLFVTFDISDNFTQGLVISGAQRATFDVLEALDASDVEYSRVFIQGNLPMQDQYGNVEDSMVLNAGYDAATVEQINYDNITIQDTIWDLRDAGMVHPELEE